MERRQREPQEADITISGIQLNTAQSMTVRVAVTSMLMRMDDDESRAELGEIGDLYRARLVEVQGLIAKTCR